MRFAVTIGLNGSPNLPTVAKKWAADLKVPYLVRPSKGTLEEMLSGNGIDALIVATNKGPQVCSCEGTLFFHPGMAALRQKRLLQGEKDNFAEALELKRGMKVLDCTMGLAGDAIIASHICGSEGRIVALEASMPIWFIVSSGLKSYQDADEQLTSAMRRIETIQTNAVDYLKILPDNSFDVVYFDPMFRRPVRSSANMVPLRPVAYDQPLEKDIIEQAFRVAPVVVVKERSVQTLEKLGLSEVSGGRYSRVKYGIRRREYDET